jgi:glycosyltransferase involved in cell wall biosynthesis
VKVLHIVSGDMSGGAAKGAYNLHKALLELGISSVILNNGRLDTPDKSIHYIYKTFWGRGVGRVRKFLDKSVSKGYLNKSPELFSVGIFGFDFTKLDIYSEADIIHLHWVNHGFIDVKTLGKIKKPVVWTLRDMWPFTGGCHYSFDCKNYEKGCGKCSNLKSNSDYDLSSYVLNRKIKSIPVNMKIIGISDWISNSALKSKIFKNFDITTISNSIDTIRFYPVAKQQARKFLNIATDKKIILIGSQNSSDLYKGFSKFIEATSFLNMENYLVCFFGNLDKRSEFNFNYISFGYVDSPEILRNIYAAADVFVAPSIMEAFGKTIAESMLCGTPAVCFDSTGPKDIVSHKLNGYLACPYVSQDIAKGIEWIVNNDNYDSLRDSAISKVMNNFNMKVIAKKYLDLYKKSLRRYES